MTPQSKQPSGDHPVRRGYEDSLPGEGEFQVSSSRSASLADQLAIVLARSRLAWGLNPGVRLIAKRRTLVYLCLFGTRTRSGGSAASELRRREGRVTANCSGSILVARGYRRVPRWSKEGHGQVITARYSQWPCAAMGCYWVMAVISVPQRYRHIWCRSWRRFIGNWPFNRRETARAGPRLGACECLW